MLFFSENLDDEQKNQLGNVVPVWFRLRYEKEILSHFIDENILDLNFIDSLPLQKLCEEICITLKLKKTVSPNEPEQTKMNYIKDVILNSKWYEFFDLIEVVGDLLSDSDCEAVEVFENLSKNDDLYFDISLHVKHKLDNYSHETYLEKVNKLFLSHLPMFYLGDKGRIHSIESIVEIERLFNKYEAAPEQDHSDKTTPTVILSTDIEWLIEQGKEHFDNTIQKSLQVAAREFGENNYLEALTNLCRVLESILNRKIEQLGENPDKYKGLSSKNEFLEREGYLPKWALKTIGILEIRNQVVHGVFTPPDAILFIICQLFFRTIYLITGWFDGNKTPDVT